eukprot:25620_1
MFVEILSLLYSTILIINGSCPGSFTNITENANQFPYNAIGRVYSPSDIEGVYYKGSGFQIGSRAYLTSLHVVCPNGVLVTNTTFYPAKNKGKSYGPFVAKCYCFLPGDPNPDWVVVLTDTNYSSFVEIAVQPNPGAGYWYWQYGYNSNDQNYDNVVSLDQKYDGSTLTNPAACSEFSGGPLLSGDDISDAFGIYEGRIFSNEDQNYYGRVQWVDQDMIDFVLYTRDLTDCNDPDSYCHAPGSGASCNPSFIPLNEVDEPRK